jgi:hypothetical protein
VKNGVKLFRIPATELGIFVCAKVNRNAGKKLPRSPEIAKKWVFCLFNFLILLIENGSITNAPKKILIDATCVYEKANNPFFMRINDPPQINARKIIATHCQRFFSKLNILKI